jgi:hypothetical protein
VRRVALMMVLCVYVFAADKRVSTTDLSRALTDDEQLRNTTVTYRTDTETFIMHGDGSLVLQTRTKSQHWNGTPSSMLFPTCRWHVDKAKLREFLRDLVGTGLLSVTPGHPGLWQNADPEDLPELHGIDLMLPGATSIWVYEFGPKARKYNLAPQSFLAVERGIEKLHQAAVASGPCTFAPVLKP